MHSSKRLATGRVNNCSTPVKSVVQQIDASWSNELPGSALKLDFDESSLKSVGPVRTCISLEQLAVAEGTGKVESNVARHILFAAQPAFIHAELLFIPIRKHLERIDRSRE